MNRIALIASLALLSGGFAYAAPDLYAGLARRAAEPYRLAFDLTSRDTLDQKAVLRWIKEASSASPKAEEIEVVMYGKGLDLVMPERSKFIADVQEAMKNPNVSFKVCAIAMKNNNIEKSQLAPGVQVVPDGLRELVTKQQEHWGYIKVYTSK